MAATPETGFLVIADLTGYTAYLSSSEIEHAPAIAGDLLETIVGRLDPPFRLAKFEGDAAFLWVEDGRAEGPLLVDAIEASYLAFRRRLRSIDQATQLRLQLVPARTAPRPQVVRPPRLVRPDAGSPAAMSLPAPTSSWSIAFSRAPGPPRQPARVSPSSPRPPSRRSGSMARPWA